MADAPYTGDKRKCFVYIDDKGEWAGPFSAAQIVDQIKAGAITWMTPIWDQLREAGMIGAWLPAWQALGIPADPNSPVTILWASPMGPGNRDVWQLRPAVDPTKIASKKKPETQ